MDTGTTSGRAMAAVAGLFAELERDLIATRTKDALAIKKAQGHRLGRPVTPSPARERIRALHLEGLAATAIASRLNEEKLTTATGLRWLPRHVSKTLASLRLDDAARLATLRQAVGSGRCACQ